MGGRRRLAAWFIFFSFLNRTGSVRFGLIGSGTSKSETEPDIFLNILTGLIDFFYWFGFFPDAVWWTEQIMMIKLVPRGRKQVDLYFNFMWLEKNNKKTDHVNISVLKF